MTASENTANAGEELVFTRPASLADRATHYCPGCHHGIFVSFSLLSIF